MYTTESRKSILTKVRLEQTRVGLEAYEHWGELFDELDVFNYRLDNWLDQFLDLYAVDREVKQDPFKCRLVCLNILARQALQCVKAVSIMLKSGMDSFALYSFRDMYEARVDAEFIRLDETGQASLRWLSKRLPRTYGSMLLSNAETKVKHWAKTIDGRTLAEISERSAYVNEQIRNGFEEWPHSMYTREQWADLMGTADWLFNQAGTPSHPLGAGYTSAPTPRELIISTTVLASRTMLAYRTAVEEYRDSSGSYDDEMAEVRQWSDLKSSYNALCVAAADFE